MRQISLFDTIIVTLLFFASSDFVFAQALAPVTPKRVVPTEFVIFPWGRMPADPEYGSWGDLVDVNAMMKDLYDCGFNACGFNGVRNLEHARNNNLGMFLIDPRVRTREDVSQEEADETIRKIFEEIQTPEDRKAVFTVHLGDEPHASLFPKFNIWSNAVKKQGVLPYINLNPDYATPKQLGAETYREHLDEYVKSCNPSYISYDNYSLFENGTLDEDRFYGNMELIREKSLEAGIPFWNVILGNAHYRYAEPSEATLGLQVWSTLAYGGKGIGYFTYYTPQLGNYRLAPIDQFGYRTKTWSMMRHINLQIHSLAPVYRTLKSVNVFHTEKIPRNARGVDSAQLLKAVSGGDLLVGEFVDPQRKQYVVVVNKSLTSSTPFNVAFKKEGRVSIISCYNRGKLVFDQDAPQRWLPPGGGALLVLE